MGTWGTGLYSDDQASDVKGLYRDLLAYGLADAEAERHVIEDLELKDDIESSSGWLTLAESEWRYGRLSETVRDKALYILDNDIDLKNWEGSKPSDINSRRSVLCKLRDKISSEQVKRRTPKEEKPLFIPWEYGDVLAFKLDEHSRYCGKYGLAVVIYKARYKPSKYAPDAFTITDIYIAWLADVINDINNGAEITNALLHPAILCASIEEKDGKPSLRCREHIAPYCMSKKTMDQYIMVGNIRDLISPIRIANARYAMYENCPTRGFDVADGMHWAFRLPEGIIEYRDVNR